MQQCMPDEHNDFADWDLRNYVFFKTEQTKTVYTDSKCHSQCNQNSYWVDLC